MVVSLNQGKEVLREEKKACTHRLITVGSNESFVSAARGQQARRCCYFKALIVACVFRSHCAGFDNDDTQGYDGLIVGIFTHVYTLILVSL